MLFPSSRFDALERLDQFTATAPRYHHERNFVQPGHQNVSRLSPAIRHRLISEYEVVQKVLDQHPFSRVEKFIQEVYWRRYWKGWLALRPQIWSEYRAFLSTHDCTPKAVAIMNGDGPISVMNNFVRELLETGYLHNHARMWFASYWIHELNLPWQWGADFFYRHLLDADPASNTLSWRWVAGLHTPGKNYLARRSNIKKFLHPDLYDEDGMHLLDPPSESLINSPETPPPADHHTTQQWPSSPDPQLRSAFWMHDEDYSADLAPELFQSYSHVFLSQDLQTGQALPYSTTKAKWLDSAFHHTAQRLADTFDLTTQDQPDLSAQLAQWASDHQIEQIVTTKPDIGYLHDQIPSLIKSLHDHGIQIIFLTRADDAVIAPLATAGFFSFWKKLQKKLLLC